MTSWKRAIMCLALIGCRDGGADPAISEAAPSPDAKILLALDHYNPQYKVDAAGRVTHLSLSWRHLPVPVMAEIGQLTELRNLELNRTTVDDEGLARLKNLQKLRGMSLVGTAITDQGLTHLEKMPSLQWLWLSRERLSEAAIDKLKQARPDMHVYSR